MYRQATVNKMVHRKGNQDNEILLWMGLMTFHAGKSEIRETFFNKLETVRR
jgi:hypothetical protein